MGPLPPGNMVYLIGPQPHEYRLWCSRLVRNHGESAALAALRRLKHAQGGIRWSAKCEDK